MNAKVGAPAYVRESKQGVLPATATLSNPKLSERIRASLKAGDFRVAFQPIVHAQTGRLSAVECLLRWQHPEYGLLLPASFVSAFDDVDVARDATSFVLKSVCRQMDDVRRGGGMLPQVAINIQPSQLVDDSLSESIRAVTDRLGLDPGLIELEVVETEDLLKVLMTHEFTRSLRRLGVRLALDDFGAGYASLVMLDRVHIDTIKLTREFLPRVPDSPLACTVVSSILDLLAGLGIAATVEGVETDAQLRWLAQRADVNVQGYLIARPQPTLAAAVSTISGTSSS
jgi:EAL domain-containing protein (putative c-di-GMP-specific phosphodiesterase class I)